MNHIERRRLRMALLCELISKAPVKPGRTALMKMAYLLQTVKGIQLGYRFRLYTYGPFDSNLLDDLSVLAKVHGAVESELVTFQSGYGYEFSAGEFSQTFRNASKISKYRKDVDWAVREFGNMSAADLELISTIIYADREAEGNKQEVSWGELVSQVKEIKPNFPEEYIFRQVEILAEKDLIGATK